MPQVFAVSPAVVSPAVVALVGDVLTSPSVEDSVDVFVNLRQILRELEGRSNEELPSVLEAGDRALRELVALTRVDHLSEDQEFLRAQFEDLLAISLLVRAGRLAGGSLDEIPEKDKRTAFQLLACSRYNPWRLFAEGVKRDLGLRFLEVAQM